MREFDGEIVARSGALGVGIAPVAGSFPNVGKLTRMTSTPDQSPAATEVAEISATDPVEKASAVEAEPDPGTSADASDHEDDTESDPRPDEDSSTAPEAVIDESYGFKALSFAAITAAHKRELGPRTVDNKVTAAEDESAEESPDEATSAGGTPIAAGRTEKVVPSAERNELFAPPAARTPSEAPTHVRPPPPPSPFPVPRGGPAAHPFPVVHDYAPEASYAGWRPPTSAEESAKRRRSALIGGAVLAVVAVITAAVVVANTVGKQQWVSLDAMLAEPQEAHPLQLVLGSCVESIPADGEVSEVLAVPCDAAHTAQVVGRTDFADAAVWPGRDDVDRRIVQVCGTKQLGPVARTGPIAGSVTYVVWGPSEKSWDDGDRVGLCLATTADPITQDLLQ